MKQVYKQTKLFVDCKQVKKKYLYVLTNSMAYGTRRFNAAFTKALQ